MTRSTRPRILHVVAFSWPDTTGYSVRTAAIVETQLREATALPTVLTSPFFPRRLGTFGQSDASPVQHLRSPHPVDDSSASGLAADLARRLYFLRKRVRHWRVATRLIEPPLDALELELLGQRFARRIAGLARQLDVDLIHAHSPGILAASALRAARVVGVPLVYELRGLWEWSEGGRGHPGQATAARRRQGMQRRSVRAADAVVCICESLRAEAIRRGVATDKTFVVPNGVDAAHFGAPVATRDTTPGRPLVLGYVGSLRPLEGVDALLRAVALLRRQGRNVRGLIIGDGPSLPSLTALAQELGIAGDVDFLGRVPHERIAEEYGRIDVFVISRPDSPAARLVTPIKPLEAMALGRAVVVSGLPALEELVANGATGLVYRAGDVEHLAARCGQLLDDPSLRERLGSAAREWVLAHRTWERTLRSLPDAYDHALAAATMRGRITARRAPVA